MITLLDDLPDHALGFSATGRLEDRDFDALREQLNERLGRHDRLNLLYWIGADCTRVATTSLWDDEQLGLYRLGERSSKVAIVTDHDWLRVLAGSLQPPRHCQTRLFGNAGLPAARDWVSQPVD